jgi:hypothetical protein
MKCNTLVIAGLCLATLLFSGWASAQSRPLPLGHVNLPVKAGKCPEGFENGTACYSSTVTCPDVEDIGFTYGVVNPRGSRGTVVFFNGEDGTLPGFLQYIGPYTARSANFQTVQVAWDTPWQDTATGVGKSLKDAACRPATLMNWMLEQKNVYSGGAMCAQGASAGAAAIAFSLAEYGASQYLKHVVLESGPVLSDLSIGCNPRSSSMTVCPGNQCLTGKEGGWPDSPIYVDGDETSVSTWSDAFGNNACAGSDNIPQSQYTAWKQMSIVDGLNDSTFSYPQTSMSGWLCSKSNGCNAHWCQNNSAAQGQLYFSNVTTAKSVYRVDSCESTEGIEEGTVPDLNNEKGLQAIIADMTGQCK